MTAIAKPRHRESSARGPRRRHGTRLVTRAIALGYLALLLALPVGLVFVRAFGDGIDGIVASISKATFQHAFFLTLLITAVAVPLNTAFGIIAALAIVRGRFRGRAVLNSLIDLPFALSPVVIGLSLILVYGRNGWLGDVLGQLGFQVIFSLPGMVLATIFVSLPFVAREVIPVLREIGTDQEEAAFTLGASSWSTFWRVTLPSIRWGVIYGVVLTSARALGEFGAVSIVSGRLSGKTETLTLFVEERYESFDLVGAYTASIVLAVMALAVAGRHEPLRVPTSAATPRRGRAPHDHSRARSQQALRRLHRPRRRVDRRAGRGADRPARSQRQRQVDAAADHRRARDARRRRGLAGRPGTYRRSAAATRRRLRLPALRAVQAHDRARQRRLRADRPQAAEGGDPEAGR